MILVDTSVLLDVATVDPKWFRWSSTQIAHFAEVEELVEPGQLDPDQIVTPGIYVKRVVVGKSYVKPIESKFIVESKSGAQQGGAA